MSHRDRMCRVDVLSILIFFKSYSIIQQNLKVALGVRSLAADLQTRKLTTRENRIFQYVRIQLNDRKTQK